MRRATAGLLLLACLAAAADPSATGATATTATTGWTVVVREVQHQGRFDLVPGDGQRVFADDEARRALLHLSLRPSATSAPPVTAWSAAQVIDCLTTPGERLESAAFLATDGVAPTRPAPAGDLACGSIVLPLGERSYRRLESLRVRLEVAVASGATVAWRLPFAGLVPERDLPTPSLPGASAALLERGGQPTLRLTRPLAQALVAVRALRGEEALAVREVRLEAREERVRLVLRGQRLEDADAVELVLCQAPRRVAIEQELRGVDLGLALPPRAALRGDSRRGADGF